MESSWRQDCSISKLRKHGIYKNHFCVVYRFTFLSVVIIIFQPYCAKICTGQGSQIQHQPILLLCIIQSHNMYPQFLSYDHHLLRKRNSSPNHSSTTMATILSRQDLPTLIPLSEGSWMIRRHRWDSNWARMLLILVIIMQNRVYVATIEDWRTRQMRFQRIFTSSLF